MKTEQNDYTEIKIQCMGREYSLVDVHKDQLIVTDSSKGKEPIFHVIKKNGDDLPFVSVVGLDDTGAARNFDSGCNNLEAARNYIDGNENFKVTSELGRNLDDLYKCIIEIHELKVMPFVTQSEIEDDLNTKQIEMAIIMDKIRTNVKQVHSLIDKSSVMELQDKFSKVSDEIEPSGKGGGLLLQGRYLNGHQTLVNLETELDKKEWALNNKDDATMSMSK